MAGWIDDTPSSGSRSSRPGAAVPLQSRPITSAIPIANSAAAATARRLEIEPGERWTSIIPLFHCAGCIMNLLGSLQTGACYVGVPSYEPEAMFRVIEDQNCSLVSGVPTTYLGMLQHPARKSYDLSSLRAGTCGGADADPEVLAACAREFPMPGLVQVYGQTESGTLITCPEPQDPARWETAGPPLIRVLKGTARLQLLVAVLLYAGILLA